MTHDKQTPDGYIGGQFITCPSCGELLRSDSPECRFCGKVLIPSEAGPADHRYIKVERRDNSARDARTATTGDAQQIELPRPSPTPLRTPDGVAIPPEYGPGFDPGAFSWPAFLFADLWHAEKGLIDKAMVHFWIRLATTIAGVIAMILFTAAAGAMESGGKDPPVGESVFGSLLALGWLTGIVLSAARAHTDARSAYSRYTGQLNDTTTADFAESRRRGLRVYWSMLFMPFSLYLVAFLLMLLTVANSKPS